MSRPANATKPVDLPDPNSPPDLNTAPRFAPAEEQADPDEGFLYVVDKSATAASDERVHELMHSGGLPKSYTFNHNKPLRLPFEIAVRFLKWDGFIRTDKDGNEIPFRNVPKRPDELQAGEKFKLADDETVARFEELTDTALSLRAAQLPESEEVVKNGPRAAVIRFIESYNAKIRVLNSSADETGEDGTAVLDDDV